MKKIYFYLKQEIWENCYFKSTFKPKQAKIVTLNGKSKKIVTFNHLVSQNWKTLLLWTRNLRKSNFAKLSLQPHTTHPHLSWFTWWYTAGASCCLLILYLVAKYQMSSGNHGPTFPIVIMLYNDFYVCACNNGEISKWFRTGHGVHQGAPESGYLFLLVAEILSIQIRSNDMIKWVDVQRGHRGHVTVCRWYRYF